MPPAASELKIEDIRSPEFLDAQMSAYKRDIERLQRRMDEFVPVNCPACDLDDNTFRYEKYRCKFVECNSCATIYMSPRPSIDVMGEYYSNSENYAFWREYIFPKSEAARREKVCKPNLEKLIELAKAEGFENAHMMEVGPGFGTFAELALQGEFFGQVTVIEGNPDMVRACKERGLTVFHTPLENLDSDSQLNADVAVCFEVIEHIFDPLEFVTLVGKQLRAGGIFGFTCPNGKGFDTTILGADALSVDTEHVNLFNPKSIGALLDRAGFDVILTDTPGRLDVQLVERAIVDRDFDISGNEFAKQIVVNGTPEQKQNFQDFLANNMLAGNLRVFARKR